MDSCLGCRWEDKNSANCDRCIYEDNDRTNRYEPAEKKEEGIKMVMKYCEGCDYEWNSDGEYPCCKCNRINKDYYIIKTEKPAEKKEEKKIEKVKIEPLQFNTLANFQKAINEIIDKLAEIERGE